MSIQRSNFLALYRICVYWGSPEESYRLIRNKLRLSYTPTLLKITRELQIPRAPHDRSPLLALQWVVHEDSASYLGPP